MVLILPSLKTSASGATISLRASIALSALYSWTNPMMATRTTIPRMT